MRGMFYEIPFWVARFFLTCVPLLDLRRLTDWGTVYLEHHSRVRFQGMAEMLES